MKNKSANLTDQGNRLKSGFLMWNATTTSDDHPNRRLPWQSVGLMVASHRGQLQRPPIARWKGRDRRFKMGETPSEIALFTVVLFSFAAAGKGLPPPPPLAQPFTKTDQGKYQMELLP